VPVFKYFKEIVSLFLNIGGKLFTIQMKILKEQENTGILLKRLSQKTRDMLENPKLKNLKQQLKKLLKNVTINIKNKIGAPILGGLYF